MHVTQAKIMQKSQNTLIKPKMNTEQTLLKLKTLQLSKEKEKVKRFKSHSNEKQYSDIGTETTRTQLQSTQDPKHCRTLTSELTHCCNVTGTLQELREKVELLMTDREESINLYKPSSLQKKRLANYCGLKTQQYQTARSKNSIPNETSYTNRTIRNRTAMDGPQPSPKYSSLNAIKMNACKLLDSLGISSEEAQYFSAADSINDIFVILSNSINQNITLRLKSLQSSMIEEKEHEQTRFKQQLDASLQNQSRLEQKNLSLLQQLNDFANKSKLLMQKIEKQQTEIYKLKSLCSQTENNLIKVNQEHEAYREYVHSTLLPQYQIKIYKQINQLEKKEYLLWELKDKLDEQLAQVQDEITEKTLLEEEVRKWETAYLKLKERCELEELGKLNIQDQLQSQQKVYYEYKNAMKDGYMSLIDNLTKEIKQLRSLQRESENQIKLLGKTIKESEQRIKQTEESYLALNDDFTRSVQDWVSQQQHYEITIEQLRQQVAEAHETIAKYSKMLASSTTEAAALKSYKPI